MPGARVWHIGLPTGTLRRKKRRGRGIGEDKVDDLVAFRMAGLNGGLFRAFWVPLEGHL